MSEAVTSRKNLPEGQYSPMPELGKFTRDFIMAHEVAFIAPPYPNLKVGDKLKLRQVQISRSNHEEGNESEVPQTLFEFEHIVTSSDVGKEWKVIIPKHNLLAGSHVGHGHSVWSVNGMEESTSGPHVIFDTRGDS
ncbi:MULTISPECIES: hypothetical protein [Pseudomonas]|uniref:Uncharacterized protein n=1 Tax=Pseudomonas peradeniyensis TaxID=2745488 RepID=A0ABT2V7G3_9PSED|nr:MULTISPECIES: hypothetical protein [Pseudomonas]MCU7237220.1 hypothetical protein [Pseudomonas peradeniyensis]MCU7280640.1 hypothetical protein [Pseudomonas peradeniyensis]QZA52892.1 hypothetical protein K2O50_17990 [Pseudomonas sp. 2hn]